MANSNSSTSLFAIIALMLLVLSGCGDPPMDRNHLIEFEELQVLGIQATSHSVSENYQQDFTVEGCWEMYYEFDHPGPDQEFYLEHFYRLYSHPSDAEQAFETDLLTTVEKINHSAYSLKQADSLLSYGPVSHTMNLYLWKAPLGILTLSQKGNCISHLFITGENIEITNQNHMIWKDLIHQNIEQALDQYGNL